MRDRKKAQALAHELVSKRSRGERAGKRMVEGRAGEREGGGAVHGW